jgi:aryl-alcohol dehydrogenase-like predicted oxidoreductase
MHYRNVGRSSLAVSAVGVGCNNFVHRNDLDQTRVLVHKALDLGITLFDTADVYGKRGGSEEYLGQVLGARRKDVVIATKFGQPMDDDGKLKGASRGYIMTAVEASLCRLRTDWIDLYQLHWPKAETPIEETLRALDDHVRQGKVRYIGASNFNGAQVVEAHRAALQHGLNHFVSFQSEYSLLARAVEIETVPAIAACGAGLLPYYPLASGLLTGKYKRDVIPEGSRLASPRAHEQKFIANANWPVIDRLEEFCRARSRTLLDLAFSWLLAEPIVPSVIAGATRPEQLQQNVAAAAWRLNAEDLEEIDLIITLAPSI